MGKLISSTLAVCAFALQAGLLPSQAQIINLNNNNSSAAINTGTSAGMFNWSVQGQNQLQQQWFWLGVGANAEVPINTISTPTNTPNNGSRGLSTVYANSQFSVQIDYLLTGGAPGPGTNQSDMAETITITKAPTVTSLDFHLFQYSAFNLGGLGQDTVQLFKIGSLYYVSQQSNPLADLEETVNSPGANHGQVGSPSTLLGELNDGVATTLTDNGGPAGPGIEAWALEWDFTLDANNPSMIISKDKRLTIVPEPAPWMVLSVGVILFVLYRRRSLA